MKKARSSRQSPPCGAGSHPAPRRPARQRPRNLPWDRARTPVLDDPPEARDHLLYEALHSLLECHLCAGSPMAGAPESHAGVLALDRHQLDIPAIRLEIGANLLQCRRDLLRELTSGIDVVCAHRHPSARVSPLPLNAPPLSPSHGRRRL